MSLRITTARWFTPSGRSIQAAALDAAMGAARWADSLSYRSDRGRVLPDGGGLIPDVLLEPDTLTTVEQRFTRALDGKLSVFRDVLTAYALELRRSGTVRSEAFRIEPRMRTEVRRRLEERDVRMADSTFRGGARIVDRQLGYELARYIFGTGAERRRRVADDREIGQAVALVSDAPRPDALLGAAGTGVKAPH